MLVQYIGQLQTKHNCGSFELLSKTAPIQASSLIVLGPFVDYLLIARNVFDYKFTAAAIVSSYCSLMSIVHEITRVTQVLVPIEYRSVSAINATRYGLDCLCSKGTCLTSISLHTCTGGRNCLQLMTFRCIGNVCLSETSPRF